MTPIGKGNRDLIREINRNLILNLIKSEGPISRTELAHLSNLSPATVSGITADFIATGLVHEMGEGESRGGRRPMMLRLNHKAGFVVGVKLMENTLTSALTDLDARVLHHQVAAIETAEQPIRVKTVLAAIINAVEQTIAASGVARERVLGIGIGMAGSVDGKSGFCRYSPFFNWHNAPIASPISEHFRLPVYLENDVNTLTIAEKWFGYGHGVEHFIVVTVGRGIGAGIVVNGQFYRGAVGSAGEVGHITLRDGDRPTTLENLASDPAVVGKAKAAIARGEPSSLATVQPLTFDAIVAAAASGDEVSRRLLADSGRWLGIGIATLVNILNPQLVIVAGEGVRAGEWRLVPMREAIRSHAFTGLADELEIIIEPSGDEAWARGAACVVLSELFKSPVHKRQEISLSL